MQDGEADANENDDNANNEAPRNNVEKTEAVDTGKTEKTAAEVGENEVWERVISIEMPWFMYHAGIFKNTNH